MQPHVASFVLFLLFVLTLHAPPIFAEENPATVTLSDCYRMALARSEEIAIQQERLIETDGRFLSAVSGILPDASFVASEKRQDGTGGSAFTLREVPERKFTVSQPIFSGFKEFASMSGARAEKRQRVHEKSRAEHLLLVDVADAFYGVLEQEADLAALTSIQTALQERLGELKEREQIGRSRPSDVASAQAQLARLRSELEQARGRHQTAWYQLEYLTGRSPVGILTDPDPERMTVDPLENYLKRAQERPDVQAAREAWRIARKFVAVERAGFWPTVSLDGNYYTKRVGNASGVDWDVTATVDVPIFQGGEVVGAVKQAASRERQAKLVFERTRRLAELEIRDIYTQLTAGLRRRDALKASLDAAETHYRLQDQEYQTNLVNNLDVLEALEELEDARRQHLAARFEVQRTNCRLQAAVGQIP